MRPPSVSLADYAAQATPLLSAEAKAYLAGAADEHTARWNEQRWSAIRLWPRVLVDVSAIDTSLSLLGLALDHPIGIAPTAFHGLFHPDAEAATAQAAERAGALYVVSTSATLPMASVAAAGAGPKWFQLYVQRDRGLTRELVAHAAEVGMSALVLTVDAPALGARDATRRLGGQLPVSASFGNLGVLTPDDPAVPPELQIYHPSVDPAVTWDTVEWLRSLSPIPLVLKGILRADDAARAAEAGVAAVVVSNHGGRNLDTAVATVDALPGAVEAVAGRVPVLVDGGIRRGTDVVKAIALGAAAVLVGRPVLWGLAVDGADGVARALALLRTEVVHAMALCGARRLSEITPDLLVGDQLS
jgi:4-hydroxymandelate oxidase